MIGYGIGYFLFETVGRPVLELYGYGAKFDQFRDAFDIDLRDTGFKGFAHFGVGFAHTRKR